MGILRVLKSVFGVPSPFWLYKGLISNYFNFQVPLKHKGSESEERNFEKNDSFAHNILILTKKQLLGSYGKAVAVGESQTLNININFRNNFTSLETLIRQKDWEIIRRKQ